MDRQPGGVTMSGRRTGSALAALALVLATAPPLRAQAVCSAPHSSPVLASGGTISTLPQWTGWIQVSALRQTSNEFFNTTGRSQPFLAEGQVRSSSFFVTGAVGVARGLDLWAQLPLYHVRYADQGGTRKRTGVGDPRFSVRASPALVGLQSLPIALRAGLKLPGSNFPVDATIIPLGEGQRDWELSVESGSTIGNVAYIMGWVGYRWREINAGASRDPGDERFAHLALGASRGLVRAELAFEFLSGLAPRQLGLELPSARRRLVQLQPTVGYEVGRGAFELTALLPLAGKNLPSGPGVSLGYRLSWGIQ